MREVRHRTRCPRLHAAAERRTARRCRRPFCRCLRGVVRTSHGGAARARQDANLVSFHDAGTSAASIAAQQRARQLGGARVKPGPRPLGQWLQCVLHAGGQQCGYGAAQRVEGERVAPAWAWVKGQRGPHLERLVSGK